MKGTSLQVRRCISYVLECLFIACTVNDRRWCKLLRPLTHYFTSRFSTNTCLVCRSLDSRAALCDISKGRTMASVSIIPNAGHLVRLPCRIWHAFRLLINCCCRCRLSKRTQKASPQQYSIFSGDLRLSRRQDCELLLAVIRYCSLYEFR